MSEYKIDKAYSMKFSKEDRKAIDEYVLTNDKQVFLNRVLELIYKSQKTPVSIVTKLARYRGFLKRALNFTEEQVSPLQPPPELLAIKNEADKETIVNRQNVSVTLDLFEALWDIPYCRLLIRSGRRHSELYNDCRFIPETNSVEMILSKKKDRKFYPVHIVGDAKEWFDCLQDFLKDNPQLTNSSVKFSKIIRNIFYHHRVKIEKKSSHVCRGIYVALLHTFFNSKKLPISYFTTAYLGHESPATSLWYSYIKLDSKIQEYLLEFLGVIQRYSENKFICVLCNSKPFVSVNAHAKTKIHSSKM